MSIQNIKIKYFCEVKDGTHDTPSYVEQSEYSYPLVTSKDIDDGVLTFHNAKHISKEDYLAINKRSNVEKYDVIMPMIGTVGNPAIVLTDEPFSIKNVALFKTSPDLIKAKYLKYMLDSSIVKEQFLLNSRGGVQSFVSLGVLENLSIIKPTNIKVVVNYLDNKTEKIDLLIKRKKKLIDLLEQQRQSLITEAVTKGLNPNVKMKDSGVEWIGEIPEHWEFGKLKKIADIYPSNVDKKSVEGEKEVLLCNYVDVYYNDEITENIEFMKATAKDEQIEKFTLKEQDVIITKDSESPTDIAIPTWASKDLEGVVCGYHLSLIRCKEGFLGHYLYYTLESTQIREQFYSRANGVTRFGLSKDAIKNGLIPIPPLKEQQEIANKLYKTNREIRKTIQIVKQQIDRLKEYRKSLIYEAVTGKIDVREMELD